MKFLAILPIIVCAVIVSFILYSLVASAGVFVLTGIGSFLGTLSIIETEEQNKK